MNILVVHYSRTETTKKVAKKLQNALGFCDIEEIVSPELKLGFFGYLKAGKHTLQKTKTEIVPVKLNPEKYDLVVIGTPVWIGTMASPVRTYISRFKDKFKNVAFFCTCGSNQDKTFAQMKSLSGKKPIATLELSAKKVSDDEADEQIIEFINEIDSKTVQSYEKRHD